MRERLACLACLAVLQSRQPRRCAPHGVLLPRCSTVAGRGGDPSGTPLRPAAVTSIAPTAGQNLKMRAHRHRESSGHPGSGIRESGNPTPTDTGTAALSQNTDRQPGHRHERGRQPAGARHQPGGNNIRAGQPTSVSRTQTGQQDEARTGTHGRNMSGRTTSATGQKHVHRRTIVAKNERGARGNLSETKVQKAT